MTADLSFNAWTSPWLPLLKSDRSTEWASPVEVLTGEKDAEDLNYPRDDFRVFARLLLSALVQAVVPAKDKAELRRRMAEPMTRAELEQLLENVQADFELFGDGAFLQAPIGQRVERDSGAAPFVFPFEDLFRPPRPVMRTSPAIGLVTLFIEQTYAGGAGRGYGSGPGGQPGVFTLIDTGSVRRSAWANSLALDRAASLYQADRTRPWRNKEDKARRRSNVGLVEGLFFQPRSAWLIPDGDGPCDLTSERGQVALLSPLGPGTETLAEKKKGQEDLWQHPCAPLAVNSQGIGAIRLKSDRPVWTGLAQLLRPLSTARSKAIEHPREGPAPVLAQWMALNERVTKPRLLILDFNRDKANIKGRFFEHFPLADSLMADKDTIERLRALVADTEDVARQLLRSLDNAHDGRKSGGFARADASSAFWSKTEGPFLTWLNAVTQASDDATDARIEHAESEMRAELRVAALRLFDEHAEMSEFDPKKQQRIAEARRGLRRRLYDARPNRTEATKK